MSKIACVFPGQGAQQVGMGKDIFENDEQAKKKFTAADQQAGFPLTKLIMEGPEEELTLTENAQPAILTVSAVLYALFQASGVRPDYVAGHSLGEYSALVAAGALTFENAVYAVRRRGLLMKAAVPNGEGTMAAVLGLDAGVLSDICVQASACGQLVQPANHNAPGQIVISGTTQGVAAASRLALEAGARRVIPLVVSGPFHSRLMEPAAGQLGAVLAALPMQDAAIPVVANCTAEVEEKADDIRRHLVEQLYSPVRWAETIERLETLGVDTYVEIGPGRVLSGLIRKIDRRAKTLHINDLASLETTVRQLKEVGQ
ncbi:MAG: ACP S-malonyltransferase [Sporolactobacillus sp.]